jgi:hypothetical protein
LGYEIVENEMGWASGTNGKHTRDFDGENRMARSHLVDLSTIGGIILNWMFKKQNA